MSCHFSAETRSVQDVRPSNSRASTRGIGPLAPFDNKLLDWPDGPKASDTIASDRIPELMTIHTRI
jgi:hypothetical protein